MKRTIKRFALCSVVTLTTTVSLYATDLTKAYDMPDASKILKKDKLAKPTKFSMPKSCKLDDPLAIARGKYIFHNLNGKKAKANPPKG
ncbi:MAG: sulfur oxidation c-type cytochrome SoxX, partial [Sulfurovaceae bacterium]|nr:sulfur oxidation c-type cytochrome SoxX [Sulfurovaceae bacterium]